MSCSQAVLSFCLHGAVDKVDKVLICERLTIGEVTTRPCICGNNFIKWFNMFVGWSQKRNLNKITEQYKNFNKIIKKYHLVYEDIHLACVPWGNFENELPINLTVSKVMQK